jgi:hypothetical protein
LQKMELQCLRDRQDGAHECCSLKTYEASAQRDVAKPTQRSLAILVPVELLSRHIVPRAHVQTDATTFVVAAIATASNFAHTLYANARNHHIEARLRADARALQTKSGVNLALACRNDLRALKLSSVVMHRMRVRERND